jgi:hypothetical protein
VKSKRVRVLLVAAASAGALTACSPLHAGAAAIVGDQRITTGELNSGIEEYQQALISAKVSADQLQVPSIPQGVLMQLIDIRQFGLLAERHGVTVTDGEIDSARAQYQGGPGALDKMMLGRAVPPSQSRAWIRAQLSIQKVLKQEGAGNDQASLQQAQQKVLKELDTIEIKISPRYGELSAQTGQLAAVERFGAADKS